MTPYFRKFTPKKAQFFWISHPMTPFFLRNPTSNAPCFRSPVGTYPSLSYSSAPPPGVEIKEFLRQKQDGHKMSRFVETLPYLKARCTKTLNLHTLKSDFSETYLLLLCLFIKLDVKITKSIVKRIKICRSCRHWDSGNVSTIFTIFLLYSLSQ